MAEKDKFKKKGTESTRFSKNGKNPIFRAKIQGPKGPNREEEGKEASKNAGKKPFDKSNKKNSEETSAEKGGKSNKFNRFKNKGKQPFAKKKKRSTGNDNIPQYNFKKINKGKEEASEGPDALIRLNRFIANAGVCSRREADSLIANGQVFVNGRAVKELGFKVKQFDRVEYQGKVLRRERKVYVLLNKPKGYITTTEDPEGRRTVMDLIQNACNERIYPVGRLDRATTGVLLFTNDGELAKALAHPSGNVKKIYRVELSEEITEEHFEQLQKGVTLEDGFVKPDSVAVNEIDKKVLGIEIHSGKNRIVRRIFEHLGYTVNKLDRTSFAGLSKKDVPRGKWRYLKEGDLVRLKHFEKF